MKKYELTEDTIIVNGYILHRIIAIIDFGDIKKGDIGGWIENERSLDQNGNAWVSGNAQVYGDARVYGDALVYGNARVFRDARVSGDARVFGDARVSGDAWVYGNARVFGNAQVYGNARVSGNADYIVFKNFWSSGRYFTWTRSNNMWIVGCFFGTGEELIKKAYKDSDVSGREYERVVRYVESILKDEKK